MGKNPRKLLLRLLSAAMVTAVLAASLHLWSDWKAAFLQAEQRVQDTARLLEEHVRGVLLSTDFIVSDAASEDHPHDLQILEAALPEKGSLWFLDNTGRVISGSPSSPPLATDLSATPAFLAHRDGADTVLSPLSLSPLTGTASFTVSHRIGDNAHFNGVVLANIEATYFTDFHRGLNLGPHANLVIATLTGDILLRQPLLENFSGGSLARAPVMQAMKNSPQGLSGGISPLDGEDRIIAYRALPDLGVMVICGIAVQDVYALWLKPALSLIAILVIMGAMVVYVAFLGLRCIEHETTTILSLEQRVSDRTELAHHQAEEARRANYGKTRFLATASHDLRQPLQAAGMFIEVLANQATDPKQLGIIEKLRLCIEATNTLLNALLDISSLECGQVQADIATFPLMPTLASLAEQMEPVASARGISLRVVETSVWVKSDPVLLQRLLRNLLFNAVRYTESGSVLLGCRSQGPHVAIQVLDTGPGVPPESQEIIFEDFTRLSCAASTAEDYGTGLGLGLGIVRRMAHLLGHRISLRSTLGRGSTFTVQVERG